MQNGFATLSFEDLILAALLGHHRHHHRFWDAASRYTRTISRRRAPNLPDDLHEEIQGEAIAQLLHIGAAGLEKRTPLQLFRLAVLRAIRKVRADNAAPAERTRFSVEAPAERTSTEQVESIASMADASSNKRRVNFETLEDQAASQAISRIEARIDAKRVLSAAPPPVAAALRLIHLNGQPVQAVADLQGISRVTLYRRVESFCARWRLAA